MNTLKVTAVALFLGALSGVSHASGEKTFETKFTYDPLISVEENYAQIEKTATRSCGRELRLRDTAYYQAYRRAKQKCRTHLIDAAVDALDWPELSALHARDAKQTITTALLQ